MGISEESVKLSWGKIPKRLGPFLIIITGYLSLAFIKLPFYTEYVGYYAGECSGTCKVDYQIQSDNVTIVRHSTETDSVSHLNIKNDFSELKFGVPLLLLTHIGDFGCPDCNDGGAYTVGVKFFGIHFSYAIERGHEPWYFRDMTNIIGDRIKKVDSISPYKN